MCGLYDDDLIEKLEIQFMNDEKFTIEKVTEYCRTYIDVKRSRDEKSKKREEIDRVQKTNKLIKDCNFCGLNHEQRRCPAYGKNCLNCGKKNHFASVCKSRMKSQVKNENVSENCAEEDEVDQIETFLGEVPQERGRKFASRYQNQ